MLLYVHGFRMEMDCIECVLYNAGLLQCIQMTFHMSLLRCLYGFNMEIDCIECVLYNAGLSRCTEWITSYVWISDMTHSCANTERVCKDSAGFAASAHVRQTWRIHLCDMTHSYMWHDTFMCQHRASSRGLRRICCECTRATDKIRRCSWLWQITGPFPRRLRARCWGRARESSGRAAVREFFTMIIYTVKLLALFHGAQGAGGARGTRAALIWGGFG